MLKKLYLNRDNEILKPIRKLIEKQNHRTLVLWTIECAERVLPIFEKSFPNDKRPSEAINAAVTWSRGDIKMPIAKKAAHATHKAATEVSDNPAACAAARALGHVIGTVHVKTHAISFVMYTITAFVYDVEDIRRDTVLNETIKWLYNRLLYWEKNTEKNNMKWVYFLLCGK